MDASQLLADAFDRVRDLVAGVVDGLTPEQLAFRVDPGANTMAWLVWHLSRVQDDHVAGAAAALGRSEHSVQVWVEEGFASRFGLPFADTETGYGQSADEVGQVQGVSGQQLREYHERVHARTHAFVSGLSGSDYDTVVDERWDPPVTLAVRLVSVVGDVTQHVGQAAFVKGVVSRS